MLGSKVRAWWQTHVLYCNSRLTVASVSTSCVRPRSSDPFHLVTCYIKWATTSWTFFFPLSDFWNWTRPVADFCSTKCGPVLKIPCWICHEWLRYCKNTPPPLLQFLAQYSKKKPSRKSLTFHCKCKMTFFKTKFYPLSGHFLYIQCPISCNFLPYLTEISISLKYF